MCDSFALYIKFKVKCVLFFFKKWTVWWCLWKNGGDKERGSERNGRSQGEGEERG